MLEWSDKQPTVGGWHFWRRSSGVLDPFYWHAYFIEDLTVWEAGTSVHPPEGGEWAPIPLPAEPSECARLGSHVCGPQPPSEGG